YSSMGADADGLARIVTFGYLTTWIGIFIAGGAAFVWDAPVLPGSIPLPFETARIPGALFLAIGLAWVTLASVRSSPIRIGSWTFPAPGLHMSLTQIAVSAVDWIASALVLWVLLPDDLRIAFVPFLGVFFLGQVFGIASQVPGGFGVFETVVGLSLTTTGNAPAVFGSLLLYRLVYYVFPLLCAMSFLGLHEFSRRKEVIGRVGRQLGDWVSEAVPQVLGFLVFAAGAFLLLSGSLPTLPWHTRLFGLSSATPFIEVSHFAGSILGIGLVLLARGLQRRADSAWTATVLLLAVGVLTTLLREQFAHTALLALLLLLLLPSRREFYRPTALTAVSWTPGWIALVLTTLLGAAILLLFSFRRLEYSGDLWWRFALSEDAPRSMRAIVGASVVASAFAFARLLRPNTPPPPLGTAEDIEAAWNVVQASPDSSAHLALLGDKRFLFNDAKTAFLMYGVRGRAWIAMGDPQGPLVERTELAWRFRELVDRNGGIPAFYEVGATNLGLYVDLGLTLHGIGESARVPLAAFTMQGGDRAALRKTLRRLEEREGCTFSVLTPEEARSIMPRLRAISDDWLAAKKGKEKSFSLGSFREDYLSRFPIGIVKRGDEIIAFADLWQSGGKEELSPDLMRYASDAPDSTMEYLFIRLILWAQEQGFAWFNLGMAPLSGMESHDLAPVTHRVGGLVYRHGEAFYNFQGLRRYKEKFDPVWESRYIACPGSFALPRILLGVTALIGGGIQGVIRK
ncbi:MAG: bifunctional lysylphosphatidylglycerol flippase/synthetase MprF, partial [Gemmatimonadetes bacterium]|nr:bifunctional lysylphosphatidylglycerol flippase/synthetase MprF [Gemmatimonadota bacterium]